MWCEDRRNGVIIADFAVQGTLAREILGSPSEIMTRAGIKARIPCLPSFSMTLCNHLSVILCVCERVSDGLAQGCSSAGSRWWGTAHVER